MKEENDKQYLQEPRYIHLYNTLLTSILFKQVIDIVARDNDTNVTSMDFYIIINEVLRNNNDIVYIIKKGNPSIVANRYEVNNSYQFL